LKLISLPGETALAGPSESAATDLSSRTLVVAFDLPPTPNAGAQRLYHLVKSVRAAGEGAVHVLTPPGGQVPSGAVAVPFAAPIPQSQQGPVGRLAVEARLGTTLVSQLRRGRYDRVVISSPLFIPTLMILAWCRFARIPYLLDIRDPYPAVYVEAGLIRRGGAVERLLQRAARAMYRGARLVTTATKGLAEEVRQRVPEQDVRARRNGHGGRAPSFGSSDSGRGRFRVACHGNFGAFQDQGLILEMVDRVLSKGDAVRFLFVGRGPGLDGIARARSERGWGDRVTVRPPATPVRLWEVLQGTHVGLSIRGDDGISRRAFPVRITDYLELGVPVVVIPHSEAGRIVDRLDLGRTFSSREIEAASDFICSLAGSPARYRSFRQRAQRWSPFFSRGQTLRRFPRDVRDAFPEWVSGERVRAWRADRAEPSPSLFTTSKETGC